MLMHRDTNTQPHSDIKRVGRREEEGEKLSETHTHTRMRKGTHMDSFTFMNDAVITIKNRKSECACMSSKVKFSCKIAN